MIGEVFYGGAYVCLRGRKMDAARTRKGHVYVADHGGNLVEFTARYQHIFLNSDDWLKHTEEWEPAKVCPICKQGPVFDADGELLHDVEDCEHDRREAARAKERKEA
jgi:hypothetical protein